MKKLMGVLCIASFILTASAYLETDTHVRTKNCEVQSNISRFSESSWSKEQEAVSLEVATMQGCPPCKRLKKETVPTLVIMGYEVTVTDRITDTRGTTQYPTLYYLDAMDNVVLKQYGFKTTEEVIEHLGKP